MTKFCYLAMEVVGGKFYCPSCDSFRDITAEEVDLLLKDELDPVICGAEISYNIE